MQESKKVRKQKERKEEKQNKGKKGEKTKKETNKERKYERKKLRKKQTQIHRKDTCNRFSTSRSSSPCNSSAASALIVFGISSLVVRILVYICCTSSV
jgi:hypothetical protein